MDVRCQSPLFPAQQVLFRSVNTDEYLKLAEVEDRMWYFHALHANVARGLRRAIPVDREARVLDAGCGTGGLILDLGKRFPRWRWSGIDFSALACEMAQRRTGADIREASITKLPFADAVFDGIATTDVICQVDNPADAFAELFRTLRPGGVAVINLPAYMWMWSYHDDAVQSKHRYTRAELKALLVAAGFEDVRLTHWNSLLFPLVFARRKIFPGTTKTSDVKLSPAIVEIFFRAVTSLERAWLAAGGRWAWGLSVLATARKP